MSYKITKSKSGALKTYLERYLPEARPVRNQAFGRLGVSPNDTGNWIYSFLGNLISDQWPFQDPKLEVRTIYKAYFLGLCKGIYTQNMGRNMVQYLHFRILKFPLIRGIGLIP
jgi:hypothetical protein